MKAWKAFTGLFEDDDDAEPRYDPVHLAGVLIGVQVVAGALFWLLWTLLVFEGGIGASLRGVVRPSAGPDAGRGLWGHLGAFVLLVGGLTALHRAYFKKK